MKKYLRIIFAVVVILSLLSLMTPLTAEATVNCDRCGRCETRCPRLQFFHLTYQKECDDYFFLHFIFIAGIVAIVGTPVVIAVFVIRKFAMKSKINNQSNFM